MPCYTVSYTSVELAVADKDMLKDALKALGYKFTESGNNFTVQTPAGQITISNGKARYQEGTSAQDHVNKIKQAYSRAVVNKVAKKYGFKLSEKGQNQCVIRRY